MPQGIQKRKTNWGRHPSHSSSGQPRGPKRIYVVKRGHSPGIYNSENKARAQLAGYSGCQWRAFDGANRRGAEAYLRDGEDSDSDSRSDS